MTTTEQIASMAAQGLGLRQIEALVGHPLRGEERTAYDRATAIRELRRRKSRREAEEARISQSERMRLRRASAVEVTIPAVANPRRRERCRKSLEAFLVTYCMGEGGFLERRPPASMRPIIEAVETALVSSGRYHVRMPRGHGKTSIIKGGVAWALANGFRHFVVAVAASGGNAAQFLRDVFAFFERSDTFAEDYPEIAAPIRALDGKTQRAKSLTVNGVRCDIRVNANELILPTVEGSPSSGATLQAVGFTANARGKVRGKMRPDLVIFDDIQDEEMAKSAERVRDAEKNIEKNFLNLGGHLHAIAALMASTPIEPDDLSETFAAKTTWYTTTFKMVTAWPNAKESLWAEYRRICDRERVAGRRPEKEGNRFYRAHRHEMDEGAEVLNADNYDRKLEVSGIQHAMNLYFAGEEQFASEYQMEPKRLQTVFDISARLIVTRVRHGLDKCALPEGAVFTAAATDINPAYALTTAVVAFGVDLTAVVVAYFTAPCSIPDALNDVEWERRVQTEVARTGRRLAALGVPIDRWGVDAGGRAFGAVTRFAPSAHASCGLTLMPMTGRASGQFNPLVRSRIRAALNDTVLCQGPRGGRWLAWNADVHKERMQLAWTAEPGAAGGLSLYDGGADHSPLAIQVANERLQAKIRLPAAGVGGADVYKYQWRTANPHDYGDCLAMCYALAGSERLDGSGSVPVAAHGGGRRRRVYHG